MQILMNVLAPHTTAIHKQDAKTQLEGLNASVDMALLEMVSAVMVCPHNIYASYFVYYLTFCLSFCRY